MTGIEAPHSLPKRPFLTNSETPPQSRTPRAQARCIMIPHPSKCTEAKQLHKLMLSCVPRDFFLLPLTPMWTLGHHTPQNPGDNLPLFQPAINLIHNIVVSIITPVNTKLVHTLRNISQLQQLGLLDGVNIQSRANMPRNMAMERPDAGIICLVL